MVYDICVKVKNLGEVSGNYIKSTQNSVYLKNALISNSNGVVVSLFKIDKKFILSVTQIAIPSFDNFTNAQLAEIIELNIPTYTEMANKVIASRQPTKVVQEQETVKPVENIKKNIKEKKESKVWNQFEANKKMFGVEPEFNMDEYAESIDRNAPGYQELNARSQKIAKEILARESYDSKRNEDRTKLNDDHLYSSVQPTNKWEEKEQNSKAIEKKTTEAIKQPIIKDVATPQKKPVEKVRAMTLQEIEAARELKKFEAGGWFSLMGFLKDRKKNMDLAQAEAEAAVPIAPVIQPTPKDRNSKPNNENRIAGDSPRQGKSKKGNLNNRKSGDKHNNTDSRGPRQVTISTPVKYASADQCVRHVVLSFKNNNGGKNRAWGTGAPIKKMFEKHDKPLEFPPFTNERIEDIKANSLNQSNNQYKN